MKNHVLLGTMGWVIVCVAATVYAGPKGTIVVPQVDDGAITIEGDFSDWPLDKFQQPTRQPPFPAARDALSFHVLEKFYAEHCTIVMAPDMAFMIGALARSGAPKFDVLWLSRTDSEGVHGSQIAKTVNLPASATRREIHDLFLEAAEMKLKGVTVYRDQSHPDQILSACSMKSEECS